MTDSVQFVDISEIIQNLAKPRDHVGLEAKHDMAVAAVVMQMLMEHHLIAKKLLELVECPDPGCVDGAIAIGPTVDGDWECAQCQWCDEKAKVLQEPSDGRKPS